jgi:hypothetical protein
MTKVKCYTEIMKLMIFLGIAVVGTLGSWLGSLLDHGNWFGLWSILLGTIGSFAGIWAGYKAAQYIEG